MMKGLIYWENVDGEPRDGITLSHRPVVIVSDKAIAGCVQVVPLTTSENRCAENYDSLVPVDSSGKASVALCHQLRTVNLKELARMPIGVCTAEEIDGIENAILGVLGFDVEVAAGGNSNVRVS